MIQFDGLKQSSTINVQQFDLSDHDQQDLLVSVYYFIHHCDIYGRGWVCLYIIMVTALNVNDSVEVVFTRSIAITAVLKHVHDA